MIHITSYIFAATPPEEILYGYGPLGIGVVVLGFIGYKLLNIILKDRDKAIADRDTLLGDITTKVIPAIIQNTQVLENRQSLDEDLLDVIRDSNTALDRNTEALKEIKFILRQGRQDSRTGG